MDYLVKDKYEAEVKEKWGQTAAYKEHVEKTKNYSKDQWDSLSKSMNDIFKEFVICMENGKTTDSEIVQKLVEKLQNFISENYYNCTNEILKGLGQMYILDERFKNNIDKHANGTALYVSDAISIYCNR